MSVLRMSYAVSMSDQMNFENHNFNQRELSEKRIALSGVEGVKLQKQSST